MHAYMKERKKQNQEQCKYSQAEAWMYEKLKSQTKFKWTRQAQWGYRLFDFWSGLLGCAVEVDGPEHDADYDNYRDEYNFRRSGIVVLHVRNFREDDATDALNVIGKLTNHRDRKIQLGISGNTREVRRRLAKLPYDPSRRQLAAFIENILRTP